ESDALDPFAKHFAAGFFELPHAPVEKDLPDSVLLRGVILPPLFDECCCFVRDGLDHIVSKKKTARDLSQAVCALICLRFNSYASAHVPCHGSRTNNRRRLRWIACKKYCRICRSCQIGFSPHFL